MDLNTQPQLPQRKDFRIGILGSGFIVNDCHLVAYRKAGFNPVAIASRTVDRARAVAERHGLAKVYESYEQLLDDPTIEVLDIAVPPNAQLDLIKAACARKIVKGILAQKPLGVSYAEAVEAVRACEDAGITLAVNQNMRYDPSVRAAKTLLENGTIGKPVLATIEMRGIPHWMPWQAELGWVTLRIMSIHHLDCFRFWFGDPDGIFCSVRPDPRTKFPHADGIATYILEYDNHLRCVGIDDTWTGPAKEGCPPDIYIRWRIEGLHGLAIGDIGWCKDPYTTPSSLRYAAKGDTQFHEPALSESWFPDAFIGTMAQLLVALETDGEPAIGGRDNLRTMALVEAAYLSAETKRVVRPDEVAVTHATEMARREIVSPVLTPRAQQVLAFARKEAARFGHQFIGTEHLLLGLLLLGQGVACNVLNRLGVKIDLVRAKVAEAIGPSGDQKVPKIIPYTPRVKRILAMAEKEAHALNHTFVGTEHLLLGLLQDKDGLAARILRDYGVKAGETRNAILEELDPSIPGGNEPPG
jgi:predicted dehydrogenase